MLIPCIARQPVVMIAVSIVRILIEVLLRVMAARSLMVAVVVHSVLGPVNCLVRALSIVVIRVVLIVGLGLSL